MGNDRYSMSFTTGSLFHRESVKLAELYLDLGDWNTVRDKAIADNLLQARTLSTLKRVCREVVSRLKTLSSNELEFLVEASHQEQAYLLWLAVCRRYRFIADFAAEVLRERFIMLKTDLTHEDYDSFFNRKSEWHVELDEITSATRNKLRQVLFKMLREADLLTANNMIHAAMLSPRLLELIHRGSHGDVVYFPAFESDLRGMA
jgi:5-bromo-4-chloroindolyl phosphate hydrolysis protein